MNDNQKRVWDYLKAWYNLGGNEFEKRRIAKLLDDYELSMSVSVVTKIKEIPPRPRLSNTKRLEELEEIVCERHGITKFQLRNNSNDHHYEGGRRSQALVDARQDFALMASAEGCSFRSVAIYLGYKEHTSIVHLIRRRKRNINQ